MNIRATLLEPAVHQIGNVGGGCAGARRRTQGTVSPLLPAVLAARLRSAPAAAAAQNGRPGTPQTYVNLLVDGIPFGDPQSGVVDRRMLPAFLVHRVGALRGPGSVPLGNRSTLDVRIARRVGRWPGRLDLLNVSVDRHEDAGFVPADLSGPVWPFYFPAQGFSARAGWN